MLKIDFKAMGCKMAVFLDDEGASAARALREVPAWFEEWEQVLSRFRPDSELNRVNNLAGGTLPVNLILWEVVQAALDTARWTGGLVAPTLLGPLERAGYGRDFDLLHGQNLGIDEIQLPKNRYDPDLGRSDWEEIVLDERNHTISLPTGVRLDLGGVAKGWAAHQAMLRLQEYAPVLVDAGGDIAISGMRTAGQKWSIAIADPLQVQESLDILGLVQGGVATSGIDYRRWQVNGVWKHHIIDPRINEPAQTDLLSVTVVAPDVLLAEAAAKVILILGSQAGMDWVEDQPQLSALLAFPDGRLLYRNGIYEHLWNEYANQHNL
jgi:thiamine biosynthesis lipoprotein